MGSDNHVLILGAGVCGLYAALTLLREGHSVTILEKGARPGGLAAGQKCGENYYDLGVHMLHEFDEEIFDDCANIMGDARLEVPLDARIKWAGSHYHYPLRGRDILRGIPPVTLTRCLFGLLLAEVRNRLRPNDNDQDAEQALISLYGRPLYEFFFEGFTHRYWEIHPRELSAEFIRSKMPRLSAVDVFKNLLQKIHLSKSRDHVEGALRFETLHYSATGSETLPRTLADEVVRLGGEIHLNAEVAGVRHGGAAISSVVWSDVSGKNRTTPCGHCLSTIPLAAFIHGLEPAVPSGVLGHLSHLRYKPIAIYGLLVRKSQCMEALYIYYRDRIFHRVGEPKNGGLQVTPDGHTVLIVEMTCEVGDAKWNGDEDVLQKILDDLDAECLCQSEDVVEHYLLRSAYGYPIFTKGFEPHLEGVQQYLTQFSNLRTTGRQGAFTYPNMHRAMRMGKNSALDLVGRSSS